MSKHESAKTSEADKIISAVSEVKEDLKTNTDGCPKCGSGAYECRRPLGGPLILTCSVCKHVRHKGRPSIAPLINARSPNTQGRGKGPSYKATTVVEKKDKNQPTYRKKGKRR